MRVTGAAFIVGAFAVVLACAGCGGGGAAHVTAPAPGPGPGASDSAAALLGSLAGVVLFPADNWWNLDISAAPVDSGSAGYIRWIDGGAGAVRHLHPDFGPPPYGIPYVVVSGGQALEPMAFDPYGSESDPGAPGRPAGYPIPVAARTGANWIEGAVPGGGSGGDRHLLVVDRDHHLLFETRGTHWSPSSQKWEAGSGAVFDLASNARRPDGWTSADAAGLAILPGLLRHDELSAPITHAFRVTLRATNGYVWPASHRAGSTAGAPPMGARLRLRASKSLDAYPQEVQRIFRAMQVYGLIVADNGTDMFVSGTMDPAWDNDVLNPAFASLSADDFEVIALGWRP